MQSMPWNRCADMAYLPLSRLHRVSAKVPVLFRYFSHLKETYGMQSLNMGEAAQAGQQIRETIHKKYGLQKGPEENP